MFKNLLKFSAIFAVFLSPIFADDYYEKAQKASLYYDHKEAITILTKACDEKKAFACFNLGVLYDTGEPGHVEKDANKSKIFYAKSCDYGFSYGCLADVTNYFDEDHQITDQLKLFESSKKACDGGDTYSCAILGALYETGQGTKQDYKKALKLYIKTCETDVYISCVGAGRIYEKGRGVEVDYKKALEIYTKACEYDEFLGCSSVGILYGYGYGVEQDANVSKKYFKKACDLGHEDSCNVYKDIDDAHK